MNLCQENIHHVPENQKFAFREVGVPVWHTLGLFSLGEDVGEKTADFFGGKGIGWKKKTKQFYLTAFTFWPQILLYLDWDFV